MRMFAGLDVGFKRTAVAISWCKPNVRSRPFGIRLPSRQRTKKFAEAAYQAVRRDNMLHTSVTALLEALAAIGVLAPDERARGRPDRGVGLHGSD